MSTDVDAPTDTTGAGRGGGEPEHLDVVIVGAGLSGIGTPPPEHQQSSRDYAILEARDDLGGTWEPVPVPGDPLGLGHAHPRVRVPPVAGDGRLPTARGSGVVRNTTQEFGVGRHVRYGARVTHAPSSSAEQRRR